MRIFQVYQTNPYHERSTRLTTSPGAAVLAQSLRDCGTSKKLAVLVTPDTLRPSTIDELRVSSSKKMIALSRCVLTSALPEPLRLCLTDRATRYA